MKVRITAIVPIKSPTAAKSRLTTLSPEHRAELALDMARVTLRALSLAQTVERVLVVTSDQAVMALAAEIGAQIIPDPAEGLNGAFRAGLAAAARDAPVLLLHADFLDLSADEIDGLVSSWRTMPDCAALVPCKDEDGTNAVLLPPDVDFEPQYGPGSFARHCAQLADQAVVLRHAAIALDIDSDEDLIRAAPGRF